jgi:hypothetical protein
MILFSSVKFHRVIIFDKRLGQLAMFVALTMLWIDQSKYLDQSHYVDKKILAHTTRGTLIVEPTQGGVLFKAVDYINMHKMGIDTVTAFPMESSIPFFTQTINKMHSDQFVNGLFSPQKQSILIQQLEKYYPRFITISNYEFIGYFGIDYNQLVYNWIIDNYREVVRYGCMYPYDKNVDCNTYGIRVFIRR